MDMNQQRINTLSIMSRAIARDRFMDDLLNLIVAVTTQVTHIRKCTLWLCDTDSQPETLCLKASHGIETGLIQSPVLRSAQGVVGLVATRKENLVIPDVIQHPIFMEKSVARQSNLVSMLGLPITDQTNSVLGVLNCFTSSPHHFSESETSLLGRVAYQAAKAIGNTEAMVKKVLVQEELEFQSTLGQATRLLMQSRHLDAGSATSLMHQWSHDASIPLSHVAEAILLSD